MTIAYKLIEEAEEIEGTEAIYCRMHLSRKCIPDHLMYAVKSEITI
jgi:hypothetical protein